MENWYIVTLDEYKEVCNNWRYWGEVRFKQLSVFLAISAVLAAAAIHEFIPDENQLLRPYPANVHVVLATVGAFLALLFLYLDENATFYRRGYLHHAISLEKILGFTQYQVTRNTFRPRLLLSESIFRIFFLGIVLLWRFYLGSWGPNILHTEIAEAEMVRIERIWTYAFSVVSFVSLFYGFWIQRKARKIK